MSSPISPLSFRTAFIAATSCGALMTSALAQAPAPPAPAPAAPTAPAAPAAPAGKPLNASEKSFVRNAAKSIHYQRAIANVAKTWRPDPQLVKLRDTTIADMTKAWDALNKLVVAHGDKEIVAEMSTADQADVDRLGKVKEDKFAKQWLEALQKESKKLNQDFDSAARSAQDPDLKTFLATYGPSVRGVLNTSEAVEKALAQVKKK